MTIILIAWSPAGSADEEDNSGVSGCAYLSYVVVPDLPLFGRCTSECVLLRSIDQLETVGCCMAKEDHC